MFVARKKFATLHKVQKLHMHVKICALHKVQKLHMHVKIRGTPQSSETAYAREDSRHPTKFRNCTYTWKSRHSTKSQFRNCTDFVDVPFLGTPPPVAGWSAQTVRTCHYSGAIPATPHAINLHTSFISTDGKQSPCYSKLIIRTSLNVFWLKQQIPCAFLDTQWPQYAFYLSKEKTVIMLF